MVGSLTVAGAFMSSVWLSELLEVPILPELLVAPELPEPLIVPDPELPEPDIVPLLPELFMVPDPVSVSESLVLPLPYVPALPLTPVCEEAAGLQEYKKVIPTVATAKVPLAATAARCFIIEFITV